MREAGITKLVINSSPFIKHFSHSVKFKVTFGPESSDLHFNITTVINTFHNNMLLIKLMISFVPTLK